MRQVKKKYRKGKSVFKHKKQKYPVGFTGCFSLSLVFFKIFEIKRNITENVKRNSVKKIRRKKDWRLSRNGKSYPLFPNRTIEKIRVHTAHISNANPHLQKWKRIELNPVFAGVYILKSCLQSDLNPVQGDYLKYQKTNCRKRLPDYFFPLKTSISILLRNYYKESPAVIYSRIIIHSSFLRHIIYIMDLLLSSVMLTQNNLSSPSMLKKCKHPLLRK